MMTLGQIIHCKMKQKFFHHHDHNVPLTSTFHGLDTFL